MTREERIQQIKDCGQTIIDKAESIYGDYDFPTSLTVTIEMPISGFPTITVKREFYSEVMLKGLRG